MFKKVFSHFPLLKQLVFDIFQIDLTGFSFISPKIVKQNKDLSRGEYDFILENGKAYFITPLQNRRKGNFENQSMIYASKAYSGE